MHQTNLSQFPFYSWYVIIRAELISMLNASQFPFYSWYVIIWEVHITSLYQSQFPFYSWYVIILTDQSIRRRQSQFPFYSWYVIIGHQKSQDLYGFLAFLYVKNHMISNKFDPLFSSFFAVPTNIFIEEYCLSVRTNILTAHTSGRFSFKRPSCFLTASIPLHTRAYTEYCSIQYPSFNKNLRKLQALFLSFFVCYYFLQ